MLVPHDRRRPGDPCRSEVVARREGARCWAERRGHAAQRDRRSAYPAWTEPPEKEVFAHPAVKDYFAAAPFEIDLDEVLAGVSDHHDYARTVAARLMMDEPTVVGVACRTYAAAHQAGAFNDVVGFVRSEVGDRR